MTARSGAVVGVVVGLVLVGIFVAIWMPTGSASQVCPYPPINPADVHKLQVEVSSILKVLERLELAQHETRAATQRELRRVSTVLEDLEKTAANAKAASDSDGYVAGQLALISRAIQAQGLLQRDASLAANASAGRPDASGGIASSRRPVWTRRVAYVPVPETGLVESMPANLRAMSITPLDEAACLDLARGRSGLLGSHWSLLAFETRALACAALDIVASGHATVVVDSRVSAPTLSEGLESLNVAEETAFFLVRRRNFDTRVMGLTPACASSIVDYFESALTEEIALFDEEATRTSYGPKPPYELFYRRPTSSLRLSARKLKSVLGESEACIYTSVPAEALFDEANAAAKGAGDGGGRTEWAIPQSVLHMYARYGEPSNWQASLRSFVDHEVEGLVGKASSLRGCVLSLARTTFGASKLGSTVSLMPFAAIEVICALADLLQRGGVYYGEQVVPYAPVSLWLDRDTTVAVGAAPPPASGDGAPEGPLFLAAAPKSRCIESIYNGVINAMAVRTFDASRVYSRAMSATSGAHIAGLFRMHCANLPTARVIPPDVIMRVAPRLTALRVRTIATPGTIVPTPAMPKQIPRRRLLVWKRKLLPAQGRVP
jgi:hypothetical protein